MPRRKTEDDEVPLPRGKIVVPAKSVKRKKTPAKKRVVHKRRAAPPAPPPRDTDAEIDDLDEAPAEMRVAVMEGLRQHSTSSMELSAQMQARLHHEPVFPYPPELRPELRPYWVELVNSFPKEHFQVSDVTLMKMYCQCAYDIERQSLMIEEEGEIVMGARSQAIVNPRCKVRESNRATLLALATKFRNQPASRMNSDNGRRKMQRAAQAASGADAVTGDEDGLLAGGDEASFMDEDELPPTRH